MVMILTPKQLNLLRWIEEFHREHEYAPTLDEISKAFKVSKITALQHLRALEKRGAIRRKRYQTRSIEILENISPDGRKGIPIIGVLTEKGVNPLSTEEILSVPMGEGSPNSFVLKVEGNSLEADHIRNGDFLICATREPKSEELIVGSFAGGVSEVFHLGETALAAEEFSGGGTSKISELKIQGVVEAVFRKY